MNEQNSPDPIQKSEVKVSDRSDTIPANKLQEQHIDLKLEVEQIYRRVERLRNLLQTLVTGLLVAILISVGVASWLSYRLLLEEKNANQAVQNTLELQKEMSDRLDSLEEQINNQERQIRQNRDQIPPDLNTSIDENRKKLQELEERIKQLENAQNQEQATNTE